MSPKTKSYIMYLAGAATYTAISHWYEAGATGFLIGWLSGVFFGTWVGLPAVPCAESIQETDNDTIDHKDT